MRLSVGTSGFSYAEWKGPFYPEDLPASEMLALLRRAPARGRDQQHLLPPAAPRACSRAGRRRCRRRFRFAVKASQRITHQKRLKDVGDETRYLLDVTQALGERLGVILFQLPPNLKLDLDRLRPLPRAAARTARVRPSSSATPSWLDPSVLERLRARALRLGRERRRGRARRPTSW